MANYLAIIHKDTKSDYGVSFPDFPGCITAGRSINVTLPEDMLRKIDRIAKKRGMSRSSFLVHAAEKVITAGSAAVYAPIKQGRNRENRRRASAEKR